MNIEIPRPNALDRIEEVAAGMADARGEEADSLRKLNVAAWLGEQVPGLLAYIGALEARNRELAAGTQVAAPTADFEVSPPGDAWYAVVFTGEGANAQVVEGWDSALALIRYAMWLDGEAPPDEWNGWLATLESRDEWTFDERGEPFRFDAEVGECSRLAIYRLAVPPRARPA